MRLREGAMFISPLPRNIPELGSRITYEVASVVRGILANVWEEIRQRIDRAICCMISAGRIEGNRCLEMFQILDIDLYMSY
jgi:hypothetical protein